MVVCPITLEPIVHPVAIKETPSIVFELSALTNWIRRAHSNPITKRPVSWTDLLLLDDTDEAKALLQREMTAQAEEEEDQSATLGLIHYANYVAGFERHFVVGPPPDGLLRCDHETRAATCLWYNAQLDFIRLFTAFTPPRMVLYGVSEMLRAYCFALIAYHRACIAIGKPISPNYNPSVMLIEDLL